MTKAQVSLEFLLVFTVSLTVLSFFTGVLILQNKALEEKLDSARQATMAEEGVRAVEAWITSGMDLDFDFLQFSYRIERSRFRVSYRGEIIESGGVFVYSDAEPL